MSVNFKLIAFLVSLLFLSILGLTLNAHAKSSRMYQRFLHVDKTKVVLEAWTHEDMYQIRVYIDGVCSLTVDSLADWQVDHEMRKVENVLKSLGPSIESLIGFGC
jgi:hypothetical protein